jgi:hypothetical protein
MKSNKAASRQPDEDRSSPAPSPTGHAAAEIAAAENAATEIAAAEDGVSPGDTSSGPAAGGLQPLPLELPAARMPWMSRLRRGARRAVRRLRTTAGPWLAMEAVLLLLMGIYLVLHHIDINHDCAGLIGGAQLVLEGEMPYVDFIELNPPWIIYVNLPHVALANLLGMPCTLSFALFMGLLLVVSVVEMRYFLRRSLLNLQPAEIGLLMLAWIAINVMIYCWDNFGQREHLFMVLYVPLLLARLLRYEGQTAPRWLWIALGIQAAVGACIKPHFVVIVAAVELVQLSKHRRLRYLWSPEMLAFAAVVLGYLLHWFVLPAPMRHEYFGRWLPYLLRGYGAYSVPFEYLFLGFNSALMGICALCACVAAWVALRTSLPFSRLLMALATVCVGGILSHLQQGKPWVYHLLPFVIAAFLALAVLLVQLGRAIASVRGLKPLRADLVVLPFLSGLGMCGLVAYALISKGLAMEKLKVLPGSFEQCVLQNTVPRDKVLVVSTSARPICPLFAQINRRSGSRYGMLFPIAFSCYEAWLHDGRPGSYWDYQRPWKPASAEESRFLAELAEDIRTRAPRLIFVYNAPGSQGCPVSLNLHDYLEHMGILSVMLSQGYREATDSRSQWRVYRPMP